MTNTETEADRSLWPLTSSTTAIVRNWRCVGHGAEQFPDHPLHAFADAPLDDIFERLGYGDVDAAYSPAVQIRAARDNAKTGVAKAWRFVVSVPLMDDESHVIWLRDSTALEAIMPTLRRIARIDATPHTGSQAVAPTWSAMVKAEPRLYAVAALARAQYEARSGWGGWERVKRALSPLVGWDAADRRLGTDAHWDEAYKTTLRIFEGGD